MLRAGWPDDLGKICPNFGKSSQKCQNIYIKAQFESPKTYTINDFWTLKIPTTNHASYGETVQNLLLTKVAQIVNTFLATIFHQKFAWAIKK